MVTTVQVIFTSPVWISYCDALWYDALFVLCIDWTVSGFETPVEWEDHQKIFGADGPEIQYAVSEIYLSLSSTFVFAYASELCSDI